MDRHIQLLGILWIVFGFLNLIPAVLVFLIFLWIGLFTSQSGVPDGWHTMMWTSGMGWAVSFFLGLLAVPSILGGIFLLKRQEWARILILILGLLNLLHIPFGTLLGIYTLWALTKPETQAQFR